MTVRLRNQVAGIFAEDDRDGCEASGRGDPVAPADDESGIVSQRGARKIILSAALRQQGAEFGELQRAERHVDSAGGPGGEVQPGGGQKRGDFAGRAHDAGADGVADGYGDAEAEAQRREQPAAPGKWCAIRSGGSCQRTLSPRAKERPS